MDLLAFLEDGIATRARLGGMTSRTLEYNRLLIILVKKSFFSIIMSLWVAAGYIAGWTVVFGTFVFCYHKRKANGK
jgi:hypothetical protein